MKVKDLMTSNPRTCSPHDTLHEAAMRMWNEDCGVLPVVDEGRVLGMVTDRDICMALAIRGAAPCDVRVRDIGHVRPSEVHACRANDDVAEALQAMKTHRVRRLPVFEDDALVGILSLNDIALEAHPRKGPMGYPTHRAFAEAMREICSHRLAVARV